MSNKQRCKTYRKNHPDVNTIYIKKRRENDPYWRLTQNIRHKIYMTLKGHIRTGEKLWGCTREEFKKYISAQFRRGMSWKNYGKLWNIDHIIPIDTYDLRDEKQLLQAFNYKNCQALLIDEHIKKTFYETK